MKWEKNSLTAREPGATRRGVNRPLTPKYTSHLLQNSLPNQIRSGVPLKSRKLSQMANYGHLFASDGYGQPCVCIILVHRSQIAKRKPTSRSQGIQKAARCTPIQSYRGSPWLDPPL